MRNETIKVESKQVPTRTTYTTDCFRKIKQEDGTMKVVRWSEDRQAMAHLQVAKGGVFHNGARIA
jgi:hypothetical protein